MDYYSDIWVAYLSGSLIEKCVEITKDNCNGCKAGLKMSVLHLHDQLSLLQQIKSYLDEARGTLLTELSDVYSKVESKLPHSDNRAHDKEIYCNNGRFYLLNCTPESLFYASHIDHYNDCVIWDFIHPKVKKPSKRAVAKPTKKQEPAMKRAKNDLDLTELLLNSF